jgi:hypothetical protein
MIIVAAASYQQIMCYVPMRNWCCDHNYLGWRMDYDIGSRERLYVGPKDIGLTNFRQRLGHGIIEPPNFNKDKKHKCLWGSERRSSTELWGLIRALNH